MEKSRLSLPKALNMFDSTLMTVALRNKSSANPMQILNRTTEQVSSLEAFFESNAMQKQTEPFVRGLAFVLFQIKYQKT
jgi:hypothetical protein